jgi:hypothetical protein
VTWRGRRRPKMEGGGGGGGGEIEKDAMPWNRQIEKWQAERLIEGAA